MDKASAIWKALDDMVDKDPEAYAKFISSQLEEGRELFGGGDHTPATASSDKAKKVYFFTFFVGHYKTWELHGVDFVMPGQRRWGCSSPRQIARVERINEGG